jgi:hypothetical protein
MLKKKILVKNKKIKELLKAGGRKGARKDFFELLKRTSKSVKA